MRSWKLLGIVAVAVIVGLVLASCAGGEETTTTEGETTTSGETTSTEALGSTSVMGVWGESELEAFRTVASGWEQSTGGTMEFEGTRDLSAILRARVSGGNPPDLAILPNPALLQEFAAAGALQPLDGVLDMEQLAQDYGQTWIDLATVDGQLYGVFVRASTKSTVWYNPKEFSANNWSVPTTWDEMIALSDTIVAAGKNPWSIAIESGAATGWPASDWLQEIVLHESGGDVYDMWVNHEIPWTDPAIKSAFERFGKVALTEGYVPGGAQAIIATNFQNGTYLPFETPPKAYMDFLGSFAQGFISTQFPDLVPVEDYDFFALPAIDPMYAGAATGGADVLVMFKNTATSASLTKYLATAQAWESWATAGGYTTPNKSLDPSLYPDELVAKAAQQLTDSPVFRFDADDLMPSEVQQAEWNGLVSYLQGTDLDQVLQQIESIAVDAYAK